ncbi:MAG: CaiB/BaiF CoA-transferase family protein [bacterium]
MSGELDGVLVVAVEQAVAAPLTTVRMADVGARVIKVERQGGDFARAYDREADGESLFFMWLNRGKQSLVADFKDPADSALLHRILGRADVFVQNLSPGAAARAGFGSAALRQKYPRLITCDITGYGEEGAYAEMRAYDMLVQAESGLASVTGTPDAPGRIGVSAVDIGTGTNALTGILAALYRRERTGQGSGVSISMFDSMVDWMAWNLMFFDHAGKTFPRTGLTHPLVAPYGAYRLKGGGELMIAVQNEREWRRLAVEVLQRPDLAEKSEFASVVARVENREALDKEINGVFSELDREELERRLRKSKIAFGAINTVPDVARHSQLRRVEVAVAGATGKIRMPAPPVRVVGEEPQLGPVPSLGQHSEAIRAEFSE